VVNVVTRHAEHLVFAIGSLRQSAVEAGWSVVEKEIAGVV
jgi:hypothetical protein